MKYNIVSNDDHLLIDFSPSVYVIAININDVFELSGNAFAITPTKVVTAFHNIYDDLGNTNTNESNVTIYREAIICQKVTKDSTNQPYYHNPILVKLCDFSYDNDWAVLELVKGEKCFFNQSVQEQPMDLKYLEICPNDYLPKEGNDLKVHCYDISLFHISNDPEEKLICYRGDFKRICLFKETSHIYRVQDGLSQGTCGCPYISKSNMVVAMHIATFRSESRTKNQLTEQNIKGSVSTNSESISTLSDESPGVNNFSYYKEGIVLSRDEKFIHHLIK